MERITKLLELNKTEYYETHLAIINCVLPVKMTPMEIKVVAAFMSLEEDTVRHRFGTKGRRFVREGLKLTHQGLTNYITTLKEKGFLLGDDTSNQLSLLPLLLPEHKEQIYLFKLVNNQHNEQQQQNSDPQHSEGNSADEQEEQAGEIHQLTA